MFKKDVKRILSVCLVLSMLFCTLVTSGAEIADNKLNDKIGSDSKEVIELRPEDKISQDLFEIMQKVSENEKIPVSIWLTDIDQEAVDRTVERKTGLTRDNLEVVKENISDELAMEIMSLSEDNVVDKKVEKEFDDYMSRTAKERKLEEERADEYISSRREVSREQYVVENDKFISSMDISDKDVIFRSQYAPMIIVELTVDEINKVEKTSRSINIEKYEEVEALEDSTNWSYRDSIMEDTKMNTIKALLNIDGKGVKVGIQENNLPTLLDPFHVLEFTTHPQSGNINRFPYGINSSIVVDQHANDMTALLAGNNSVASGAVIYNAVGIPYEENVEWLINKGVSVISRSLGGRGGPTHPNSESNISAWYNHISSLHSITFVNSAGNERYYKGQWCYFSNRAVSDNIITVTAARPRFRKHDPPIINPKDYELFDFVYEEGTGNCFKPDIASDGGSTSQATAFTSGVIALMMQLRPSLKTQPHAVKAILMASCHEKAKSHDGVQTEHMYQGLTERQGAGVMNPYIALAIIANGTYGTNLIQTVSGISTIPFTQVKGSSTGLNVSLAWLREVDTPNGHSYNNTVTSQTRQNLNLDLYLGDITTSNHVGGSSLGISSTEMVYLNSNKATPFGKWSTETNFYIRVKKQSGTNTLTRYAYAWSVNDEKFRTHTIPDGWYNIQGYHGRNLLVENANPYSGAGLYLWYSIYRASNFYFEHRGNGYYRIKSEISNRYITVDNDSLADCGNIVFRDMYNNNGDSQLWRLQKHGDYYILINKNSGKVIDVANGWNFNGAYVWQYGLNYSEAQQFKLFYNNNPYRISPIMTSNTAPAPYAVTAKSSWGSGYEPYRAFNGNWNPNLNVDADYWASSGSEFTNGVGQTWLQIDLGEQKRVNRITFQNGFLRGNVKHFRLLGSNNGTGFATLFEETDVQKDNDFQYPIKHKFNFENENLYRYYRIEVLKNHGDAGYVGIGQIELEARSGFRVSPIMTSDMTPSPYEAVEQNYGHSTPPYQPWNAFDGNWKTDLLTDSGYWWSGYGMFNNTTGMGQSWIQIDLGEQRVANELHFQNGFRRGIVRDFMLQGSNNGTSYTNLISLTDIPEDTDIYNPKKYVYKFNNTTAYRYYRFKILRVYYRSGTSQGQQYASIGQLELWRT